VRVVPAGLALLMALLLAPEAAQACAVCFAGKSDGARVAFIATTGFLTLMPLLLLGVGIWWVRKRLRADEAAQDAHRVGAGASPEARSGDANAESRRAPARA